MELATNMCLKLTLGVNLFHPGASVNAMQQTSLMQLTEGKGEDVGERE